jgi:hypothetical protein
MLNLLAIDFGSPWLLTGLAGASIPIIIHLLNKRRYRETPWAAMKFLAEAARKHSRRLRWEQLLLLLVRCLAVGLLALAFSRPFFESADSAMTGRDPRHLILVIDDSFSMSHSTSPKSRLDRALDLARQLVEESRSGDAFSLLALSGSSPAEFLEPTFRADSMLAQLASVEASERPADVSATLSRIENLLAAKSQPARKEVAIVSDFQLRDWPIEESAQHLRMRKSLERLAAESVKFTLLDVGHRETSNAAVTSVEITPRPLLVGQLSTIEAEVQVFGEWPESGFVVELEINGKTQGARNLFEEGGDRRRISFEHQWSAAGPQRVVCRVREDPLSIDDSYFVAVEVRDAIRVLLVEGRSAAPPRDRTSYYLRQALATVSRPPRNQPTFQVSLVDELGFADHPLDEFHAIALCNLPTLPEFAIPRLREFLQRGGGLLVSWGDLTRPAGWNAGLDRLGEAAPPFKLLDADSRDPSDVQAWGFLTDNLTHPAVEVFQGNPGTGLESSIIWQRQELLIDDPSRIIPVLRFDDGSPAILEWDRTDGRILITRMSLDARSGSWTPLSGSFPPVAIRLFEHLAGSNGDQRDRLVGESLSGSWGGHRWTGNLKVSTPGGGTVELEPLEEAVATGEVGWTFPETDRSGFYEVSFGSGFSGRELFGVNVDRSESDPSAIDAETLERIYFPRGAGVRRSSQNGYRGDETLLPIEDHRLIAALLLVAAALVVTEVAMAWKFAAGLICLGGFVLLGSVVWSAQWTSPTTALSAGVLIAALATVALVRRTLVNQRSRSKGMW